jgi:hypothetical protein
MTAFVGVMMAGAVMLHILPAPCKCEKCGFHVNERRVSRETERERVRVVRHRHFHNFYHTKWGDVRCPDCRDGHSDDQGMM